MQGEISWLSLLRGNKLAREVLSKVRESPEIRGWRSQIFAAILIFVLTVSGIKVRVSVPDEESAESNATTKCEKQGSWDVQALLDLSPHIGLLVFVAEMLRRFCLLVEEIFHLESRYDGQFVHAFHKVFLANGEWTSTVCRVSITVVLAFCFGDTSLWLKIRNNLNIILLFMAFYLLLVGLLRVDTSRIDVETSLEKLPLSPAEGLACSHFYGYLKIIFSDIRSANNEVEDFESRIQRYENRKRIKIVRKVFVFIPDSCDISQGLDAYGLTPLKKTSSEVDDTLDVVVERAGSLSTYGILVCKLEGRNGQNDRYVMVNIPRALETLKDMNNSGQRIYSWNEEPLASQAVKFNEALDRVIRDDRDFSNNRYTTTIETFCLRDTGEDSTSWNNGELEQLIRNRIE